MHYTVLCCAFCIIHPWPSLESISQTIPSPLPHALMTGGDQGELDGTSSAQGGVPSPFAFGACCLFACGLSFGVFLSPVHFNIYVITGPRGVGLSLAYVVIS